VAIVTSPARYAAVLDELEKNGRVGEGLRSALAVEAFRHTGAYDARIAAELPARMAAAGVDLPDEPGLPGSADPYPPTLVLGLEKVETLRYGENPHQQAARYRRPGTSKWAGPFALGGAILQGKALSYNNVLDASGADAIGRALRGPACVVVKHTNPCGAAERATLLEAWQAALAGDPVSAYGGVVALTREVDAATAEGLASIFLEVIVAPSYSPEALAILARKTNLRLLEDPILGGVKAAPAPDPLGSIRVAGGGVLVTAPDVVPDDPATWKLATSRAPSEAEMRDLDLAWRLCRGVVSNAIVLVKDGMEIGLGSGQTSRVDAARQAVAKAIAFHGAEALRGAACGSDAFYPFPDAVQVCLDAGVTVFAQPGGSMRDAEAIEATEKAGASMLITGVRHFRH
jgi:phosphoribosylaminoimidazolecarboxamide formyltransferase/IMP cyclohydrolase